MAPSNRGTRSSRSTMAPSAFEGRYHRRLESGSNGHTSTPAPASTTGRCGYHGRPVMMPDAVRQRIEALAASSNPLDREVARRLAGRLPTTRPATGTASVGTARPPSPWAHVDFTDLLVHFGNGVQTVGEHLKAGHEPIHGSRSGLCLVAWPITGRWWCSSCGRSGDAAAFVMEALGV